MVNCIIILILYLANIWEVNSKNLDHPVGMKYSPCGLAFIQFTKMSRNKWKSELHLDRYGNLEKFEVLVAFGKETNVFACSMINDGSIILKQTDNKTLIVQTTSSNSEKYISFYVARTNLDSNESDIPVVTSVTINNDTICDEKVKANPLILGATDSGRFDNRARGCGRKFIANYELKSPRSKVEPGDWPWHAAVCAPSCDYTGTILSSTAIITTAIGVYSYKLKTKMDNIRIIAGSVNSADVSAIGRQTPDVVEVIVHPAYIYRELKDDLAIIKVTRLEFTEYVQPVCIWGPFFDNARVYKKEAMVIGYQRCDEDACDRSTPKSSDTIVQNETTCVSDSRYSQANSFFCASPLSIDFYAGASLLLPEKEADDTISWYLRGIYARCFMLANKRCDPKRHVGFVDVTAYYAWIRQVAGLDLDLEPTTPGLVK